MLEYEPHPYDGGTRTDSGELLQKTEMLTAMCKSCGTRQKITVDPLVDREWKCPTCWMIHDIFTML